MEMGLGPGKTAPGKLRRKQCQRRRLRPAPPLKRIARRDGRESISYFEILRLGFLNPIQLFNYAARWIVLSGLQIGIDEIAHRMKLVVPGATQAPPDRISLRR